MPTAPPKHRPLGWKPYVKQFDKARGGSTARGYGYRWQQFRARYLAQYPLCVECQKHGYITVATDVDHVTPHKGDMSKFWEGPFQGLCHTHHSEKTARGE